jgi:hypothetical protein
VSRFIAVPRRLDDMIGRPTLADAIANSNFVAHVDLGNLGAYDPTNMYHQAVANMISEGVYRNHLLNEALPQGVDTGPLYFEFNAGHARTRVAFKNDCGRNAGLVVFERVSGGSPTIFKPGMWLMRFRDIQEAEEDLIRQHLKQQNAPQISSESRYAPVDDSDLFGTPPIGFRLRRNVVLPEA